MSSKYDYSPKFQEILDKVDALQAIERPIEEIQEFFCESVRNLGKVERLNNLYKIRRKDRCPELNKRIVPFRMNRVQRELYKRKTNRDLVLKMRQVGITTVSCLDAIDSAIWEENYNSAIMAEKKENVKKYFRIVKLAFEHFQKDWGLLCPVTPGYDNVNELTIKETGSTLSVCTETKGLTLDFLHISEACFVPDDRISESVESVPFSGRVIMESTPDAAAGMFYDMWDLFFKGQTTSYTAHFFPWWFQYPETQDIPALKARLDNDIKLAYTDNEQVLVNEFKELTPVHILWRRFKISECGGNVAEFLRLYPEDPHTCFLAGSQNVFPAHVLSSLTRNQKPPVEVGDLVIQ